MSVNLRNLHGKQDHDTVQNFKILQDSHNTLDQQVRDLSAQLEALTGRVPTMAQINAALSSSGSNPLNLTGLIGSVPPPAPPTPNTTTSVPSVAPVSTPPESWPCYSNLAAGQPGGIPPAPNVRWYRGNFCGVHVSGLPGVYQGSADTTLVFSPFIDRYDAATRASIYQANLDRGYTHFQVSWLDSRVGNGQSAAQFIATCQEIQSFGLYPVVFVMGKGDFPNVSDMAPIIDPVVNGLIAAGAVATFCVAWEASLWMSPDQTQAAIDHVTDLSVPAGIPTYIHFQQDYTAFPNPDEVTAAFWNRNVGRLTGLYFQADPFSACGQHQERIIEGLIRFAGNAGYAADSGFGHPFDFVPWEISATTQFFNGESEADGNVAGFQTLCTPAQTGPAGTVGVMGFGNGATYPDGSVL